MKLIVAGDFCPNCRASKLVAEESYDQIFGGIKDLISSVDISIVNFETCVNEHNAKPIIKQGPNLCTTSKAVDAVKYAGFHAATLANNHFYDYGDQGVKETIAALDNAGIKYVGGGENLAEAEKILYMVSGSETIAIINCCEHEFSIASEKSGGSNPLNPIKQYYAIKEAKTKADYVLVIIHGGIEHFQLPSMRMKETYKFFVDAGADAVINHHQHCYSGYEIYKGKPICYGLGNFCFDWPSKMKSTWYEGCMVQIEFNKHQVPFRLIPYKQCYGNVSVELLVDGDISEFNNKVDVLSKIIRDDYYLKSEVESFNSLTEREYQSIFEPYSSRVSQALYRKRLLPTTLNTKRILKLLDYLNCESHHDRVKNYLFNSYNSLRNE